MNKNTFLDALVATMKLADGKACVSPVVTNSLFDHKENIVKANTDD